MPQPRCPSRPRPRVTMPTATGIEDRVVTIVATGARAGTTAATAGRVARTVVRAPTTARGWTVARAWTTARVRIAPRSRIPRARMAPRVPTTVPGGTGQTADRGATAPTADRAATIDRRVGPVPLRTCRPRRLPR